MMSLLFTVISCTARCPKSINLFGMTERETGIHAGSLVAGVGVRGRIALRQCSRMNGCQICPDHTPFPTAWKLPFHPVSGSQTSNLISESCRRSHRGDDSAKSRKSIVRRRPDQALQKTASRA